MPHVSKLIPDEPVWFSCCDCHESFAVSTYLVEVAERCGFKILRCPQCADRLAIEDCRAVLERARQQERGGWNTLCPARYLDTDPAQLPLRDLLSKALEWRLESGRNLVLHGDSGLAKSRVAWKLVEREYRRGRSVAVLDQSLGSKYLSTFQKDSEGIAALFDKCSNADVLLLDDVFKVRLSDGVEAFLYSIIARRYENRKPFILTLNDSRETLLERLSSDRGGPLVRRLIEGSDTIAFTKQK